MVQRVLIALLLLSATAHAETLTLEAALKTGLRSHPALMVADANRDAAFARIGEAYSNYLPDLNYQFFGRGDYSSFPPVVVGTSSGGGAQNKNSTTYAGSLRYSGALTLSQTIYDFGRTRWAVAAARSSLDSSRADRETARATVELGVASAYYGVLQAIALKQVADDALAQSEQHLAQASALYRIGTRPEIDVASAESARAQAKLSLVHAKNAVAIAKVTLNAAMGIVGPIDYEVVPQPIIPVEGEGGTIDPLVAEAVKTRPEYASLRYQVDAANANLKNARASYYPTLTANGGVTATGNDTQPDPGFDFSTQLTLSGALFSGWQTKRTVEEMAADVRAADANLEALALSVRTNVATAALGVQEAVEAVDASNALVAQAEKQLALATGRYNGGVGTIIELVDAQVGAVNARNQKVQAEYTLATSRATLLRALGRPLSATAARGRP